MSTGPVVRRSFSCSETRKVAVARLSRSRREIVEIRWGTSRASNTTWLLLNAVESHRRISSAVRHGPIYIF